MEGYFRTLSYQLQTAAKFLLRRPALIASGLYGWLAAPLSAILKPVSGPSQRFLRLGEDTKFDRGGYPENMSCLPERLPRPPLNKVGVRRPVPRLCRSGSFDAVVIVCLYWGPERRPIHDRCRPLRVPGLIHE